MTGQPQSPKNGDITLEGVSFAYRDKEVLHDGIAHAAARFADGARRPVGKRKKHADETLRTVSTTRNGDTCCSTAYGWTRSNPNR